MRGARRRSPFLDLRSAEVVPPAAPRLFLGQLDEAALSLELEQAGILAALRERGYPELRVHTEYQAGEHDLDVEAASDVTASLIELGLAEGAVTAPEPMLRACERPGLAFLSVHRLLLQDPARSFSPERPKLPGQRHPGLGLLSAVLQLVRRWAERLEKDALLYLPQYYHNAVFCCADYQFVDPVRQGRFLALRRDLSLLHVAQASAAVGQGRVIEEPWGAPFQWEAGEMIVPLAEPARRCLLSREYTTAVERARDAARFRLR